MTKEKELKERQLGSRNQPTLASRYGVVLIANCELPLGNSDGLIQEIMEESEILMKYEGYIEREKEIVTKMERLEEVPISDSFDFEKIKSLSTEARQKLSKVRPQTLGQASRISGVSPSDVSVLMVYLGR
jgi:tRNA U34 5-carboxymethylaminomethyl modifying enzyme MnmG/GidA